mgnify:CR=1 FL=1
MLTVSADVRISALSAKNHGGMKEEHTVEDQLGAAGALVVDAASNAQLALGAGLARLEVTKLLMEFGVIVGDLELVRIRVGLGILEYCCPVSVRSSHMFPLFQYTYAQRHGACGSHNTGWDSDPSPRRRPQPWV